MATNTTLSRTSVDEAGVATGVGCGALSSRREGANSVEMVCRLGSEPSAEVGQSETGIAPNVALPRTAVDGAWVPTRVGCGALSSFSKDGNSEETACRPGSAPSAEVPRGAAGTAPKADLSSTTMDEAGVVTGLGSGVLPSCSEVGNWEETACRSRSALSTEKGRGATGAVKTEAAKEPLGHAFTEKTQLDPREPT